jgi:F-type H+-transporting ATPase subunit alpha
MPMERQVVSVYAGTSGALDAYPTAMVGEFEKGLHRFIEDRSPKIFEKLKSELKLTDEVKGLLDAAIAEFKQTFSAKAADAKPAAATAKPAAAAKPAEPSKPATDANTPKH